jgi:integrase/recombinase XerD
MLGHANLEIMQSYTQVSIRQLKVVHTATHPGRLAKVGQHPMEAELEPSLSDSLEALNQKAEEKREN